MTTITTLTVTLHESIYQSLDRVVEHEVDEQYRRKYGDAAVNDMLRESIELNEGEWHRLLQKGYKGSVQRGTINFDSVWYDASVILEDLGVDELDLEIDRRECRFIMKYERLNEELTIYDMEKLTDMLGHRVLEPQCVESVEFETTNWLIPECVVHLELERGLHKFHICYETEYKEEVSQNG